MVPIRQFSVVIFLIQLLRIVSSDGTQCTQVFNFDALFSLLPLKQKNYFSYSLTATQGTFTTKLNETVTALDSNYVPLTLYFNFCDKVNFITTTTSPDTCATQVNADKSFALTMVPATTTCDTDVERLTSDSRFDNYQFDLIDVDSPQNGIIYTLNKTGTTFNSSISYIIYCDSSDSTNTFTVKGWRRVYNATSHHYYIEASSYYGCPSLQISKIWEVLSDNKYLMAALMISLGGVLCFFGLKIYKPTMFIVGYLTGFAAIVVLVGEFVIRYDSESVMAYVCLIIAVFFGVLTGYVTIKTPKIGFFALGMWLGIVIALLLNNAVLYKIQIGNTAIVLWITIGILSLSMGVLSCFFYKHCVMICTGFIGAYLLIRPFGWMIGSFPNELEIAKELEYGTLTEVPSLFYLYMALILLIGMIGIRFQWGMYLLRRQEEEENDLQLFLADPDFIEMNKGLLDKEDTDLTEKEKKVKAKVIRMQKNVEKEQKKQDRRNKKIQKLKGKGETTQGKDSEDEEEEENDSDDKDEDDSEDEKDKKKGKKKEEKGGIGLGFFGSFFNKEETKTPKNKKKGKKQSSDEDDDEEPQEDSDEENQKKKNKSKLKKTSVKQVEKQPSRKQSTKMVPQKKGKNQDSSDEEMQDNNNSKKFASMVRKRKYNQLSLVELLDDFIVVRILLLDLYFLVFNKFAGIKKNKPTSDDSEGETNGNKKGDIEMDDLSDKHSAIDQTDIQNDTQVTAPKKSIGRKSVGQPAQEQEKEGSDDEKQQQQQQQQKQQNGDSSNSEEESNQKKKTSSVVKSTAQLAKSQKKSKKK